MAGSRDLAHLLTVMQPALDSREFVFLSVPAEHAPAVAATAAPLASVVEPEGTTYIVERDVAVRLGLPYTYPCRHITLTVHSSLDAVGFLAAITAALADAGISANAVSASYHDHLFVPVDRAADAMAVLVRLASAHAIHPAR